MVSLLNGFVDDRNIPIATELLIKLADLVIDAMRKALESLEQNELKRLRLYRGGMSDQAIAKVDGENTTTAFRKRKRAIANLKESFWSNLKESDFFPAINEHLPQLKKEVRLIFTQILESAGGEQ